MKKCPFCGKMVPDDTKKCECSYVFDGGAMAKAATAITTTALTTNQSKEGVKGCMIIVASLLVIVAGWKLLGRGPDEKQIWLEYEAASRKLHIRAGSLFPPWHETLTKGDEFVLTETTPLMPELNPFDVESAMMRSVDLSSGLTIRIREKGHRSGVPWYSVDVIDRQGKLGGVGWVNSQALMSQNPDATRFQSDRKLEYLERERKAQACYTFRLTSLVDLLIV